MGKNIERNKKWKYNQSNKKRLVMETIKEKVKLLKRKTQKWKMKIKKFRLSIENNLKRWIFKKRKSHKINQKNPKTTKWRILKVKVPRNKKWWFLWKKVRTYKSKVLKRKEKKSSNKTQLESIWTWMNSMRRTYFSPWKISTKKTWQQVKNFNF